MPSNIVDDDHPHHSHSHLHPHQNRHPYVLPNRCYQCGIVSSTLLIAANDDDGDDENDDPTNHHYPNSQRPRYCNHCMIHKQVRVYWPVDSKWYTGIVQEYDERTNEHKLQYSDGDTEWVKIGDLSNQQQQQVSSLESVPVATTRDHDHGRAEEDDDDDDDDDDDEDAGDNQGNVKAKRKSKRATTSAPMTTTTTKGSAKDIAEPTMTTSDPSAATVSAKAGTGPKSSSLLTSSSSALPSSLQHGYGPPPPSYHYGPPAAQPTSTQSGMDHHHHHHAFAAAAAAAHHPAGGTMMYGTEYPPSSVPSSSSFPYSSSYPIPEMMHHHHPQYQHYHHQMMMMQHPMGPTTGSSSTAAAAAGGVGAMTNSNTTKLDSNHLINSSRSLDIPLSSHHHSHRSRKSGPKPWTKEEDHLLLKLVHTMQWPMKWTVVALSLPERTGKQCRERYVNHLNPRLKNSDWAPIEDATIFHLYNTIGSHWAKMSKIIAGRTDNGIKNRFHNIKRQYEREETHRLRLSNIDDHINEIRIDRLRNFPDHMSGKTHTLWDMKYGIGIIAAQSIINGSSSCNTAILSHQPVPYRNHNNNNSSYNGEGDRHNNNNYISSSRYLTSTSTTAVANIGAASTTATTINRPSPATSTSTTTSTTGYIGTSYNNRFGPFREVIVLPDDDDIDGHEKDRETKNDDGDPGETTKSNTRNKKDRNFQYGPELCVRCGFMVPSIQTGNEICTKTGWCISCVFIPPNICSNLLRETLNLRRCVNIEANKQLSYSNDSKGISNNPNQTTSRSSDHNDSDADELRDIIESFEEFFHPKSRAEAWPYSSMRTSDSTDSSSVTTKAHFVSAKAVAAYKTSSMPNNDRDDVDENTTDATEIKSLSLPIKNE